MENEENKLLNEFEESILQNDTNKSCKIIKRIKWNPVFYKSIFLQIFLERKEVFHNFLQKFQEEIDVNLPNTSGNTLLHQSLKCSDNYFLKRILETGRVSFDSFFHKTIVCRAVSTNKIEFVEPILKVDAPINKLDISGMTPLDIAIENNNFDIISMLLYYNCDVSLNEDIISPFMYSMICDCDQEIQLLLLEYETDINNCDFMHNNLFIAVEQRPNLIPNILNYGGDVNETCRDPPINIIDFIFDHPIDPHIFQLIWDKFEYETWQSTNSDSILNAILSKTSLPNKIWNNYLCIIIQSNKLEEILEQETYLLVYDLVCEYLRRGFNENDLYEILCILLSYGCHVDAIDVHKVYRMLKNNSKVLDLLINMDIERNTLNIDHSFVRVRYSFNTPTDELLRNFLFNMHIMDMSSSLDDIRRFFSIPSNTSHFPKDKITNCFPTLIELARNKSRDHICSFYKIKSGGYYACIINNLEIPKILKSILLFKKPLYFDT